MKSLRPLDPTWWRKAPGGYDQQDGRARLMRLRERDKIVGWALYVDGERRGDWPRLAQAKHEAARVRVSTGPAPVPGYSNFGGGGPFAPMGSPAVPTDPRPTRDEARRRFMRRGLNRSTGGWSG